MRYKDNTIYICGSGKTADANPISRINNLLTITLILEKESGMILSAEMNSVCQNTSDFLASILEGESFYELDFLIEKISSRYFGTSRKTIVAALKDAYDKLGQRAQKYHPDIPPCKNVKR
ncbi:MAG: DUF3870 domain-containing protein [Lachnospiraceae bacterium]|nr:DUF3870 domain-containing protein [Lachnospiraceae bacterium]